MSRAARRRLLAVAALLCCAPVADAAGAAVAVPDLVEGPVVAGDGIVWVERRAGRFELRSADLRGGDRRLLARLGPTSQLVMGSVTLSGSRDGYAALVRRGFAAAKGLDSGTLISDAVLVGGRRERSRRVAGCDGEGGHPPVRFADRAFGAVASVVRRCAAGPQTLEIRAPAAPGDPVRRLPATEGSLSASYFAYHEEAPEGTQRLVVHDWRQDRVAYSVPLDGIAGERRFFGELEVGDDGRLAFSIAEDLGNGVWRDEVWTATVADPRPVRLPLAAREISLSGGTIGFLRTDYRTEEVGTYDLATGRETVVADGFTGILSVTDFDLQGETLAWRAAGCTGMELHVGRAGAGRRRVRAGAAPSCSTAARWPAPATRSWRTAAWGTRCAGARAR